MTTTLPKPDPGNSLRERLNLVVEAGQLVALNPTRRQYGASCSSLSPDLLRREKQTVETAVGGNVCTIRQLDYPADIYCSGESLTLLCDIEHVSGMLNPELLAHARRLRRKIVRWTVNHMQNRDGSFCYRLYRWGRINPRSIRWGQAIMLKALARLLLYETKSKD